MVTTEMVKEAIDNAEGDFLQCWGILAEMKGGPIPTGFGEQFLTFQPTLARALFQLDELYRNTRKEEKQTIAQKRSLNPEKFVGLMRSFSDFRSCIKSALEVGKSIGDAFAWFFYRKSQDKIAQHLQHSSIPHTPPGIGGKAEIAFLEIAHQSGFVAIYHGITSFLRIGDVSFIDLRSGDVVALGEIKSRKAAQGKVVATVHVISNEGERFPFSGFTSAPDPTPAEDVGTIKEFSDRLERQIGEMRAALNVPRADRPDITGGRSLQKDLFDGYHYDSLQDLANTLEREETAYQQAGNGLLLVGLNVMPEERFSKRIFEAGDIDFKARLGGVIQHSMKLFPFASDDNAMRMGAMTNAFSPRLCATLLDASRCSIPSQALFRQRGCPDDL